jgi:hypothetical protein
VTGASGEPGTPGDGASGAADAPGGAPAPDEADAPGGADAPDEPPARQRVERTGRRRARLTPAPDTDTSPEKVTREETASGGSPDDDRITRERPPHW